MFPETERGSLRPLIGTDYLETLDKRLFDKPLSSLCRKKADFQKEETETNEHTLFEDNLINRLLRPPKSDYIPHSGLS